MNHPSDTPPDGDFARYVERLTAANRSGERQDMLGSPITRKPATDASIVKSTPSVTLLKAPAHRSDMPKSAWTSLKPLTSFGTHVRWALGLWVVSQVLGRVWPGAGYLFIPALLAYAGWTVYRVNQKVSGGLLFRLQELAGATAKIVAAAEARKAQTTRPHPSSKKP